MRAIMLLLGLSALAAAASAAPPQPAETSPRARIAQLTVYGDDPCPRSTGDEIIVCARQPESERYRLPKRFRDKRRTDSASAAWGARSLELETVSREGLPNSCNTGGSNGQTGCFQKFLAQARAERELAKREAADIP